MSDQLPPRQRFTEQYATPPPWDIGKPQRPFVDAADNITGSVLDAGCGTGENALHLASLGREVTGVDFVAAAIEAARQKAAERKLPAEFHVLDATRLDELGQTFDNAIDCGLFHVFPDDTRALYVSQLANVLRHGGNVWLMCFSDKEPQGEGPRRVSEREIRNSFADGWVVESLSATRFEVRPEWVHLGFSEGGPHAWFCRIRRDATKPPRQFS